MHLQRYILNFAMWNFHPILFYKRKWRIDHTSDKDKDSFEHTLSGYIYILLQLMDQMNNLKSRSFWDVTFSIQIVITNSLNPTCKPYSKYQGLATWTLQICSKVYAAVPVSYSTCWVESWMQVNEMNGTKFV